MDESAGCNYIFEKGGEVTWTLETSRGYESDKIAHLTIPYTQGKGLDIGCGSRKCWPRMIGVDSLLDYGGANTKNRPGDVDVVANSEDLSMFSNASMDYVFSSHNLEHIIDYKAALKEWWRVIKSGGYLLLYLPHANFYPRIGQPGSNPDHKHDFLPSDIVEAMKEVGSWELLENEERNGGNEYSFYTVFKKIESKIPVHKFNVWQRNPNGLKRCLCVRYGAIGDALIFSSIFPQLKKQGYYVTVNCAPKTHEILKHDPNIDEFIVQEEDYVPNAHLGPYWAQLGVEGRWDKIINLCESIEGALLTLPDRMPFHYPHAARHRIFNVNYLERTHDIAGVPYDFNPRFYPTDEEREWAKGIVSKINGPIVAWSLNGSSVHKVYPWVNIVTNWLAERTPAHIFLLGDAHSGSELETGLLLNLLKKGGCDMNRIHPVCGKWTIRQALTFVQYVNCVVGPETGVLNSVCMEPVPKVIYLSHSSHENLTKHWKKTVVLEPEASKCPCFPCHRMQYDWSGCHKVEETGAALCASSIKPETVFEAITFALGLKKITKEEALGLPPVLEVSQPTVAQKPKRKYNKRETPPDDGTNTKKARKVA